MPFVPLDSLVRLAPADERPGTRFTYADVVISLLAGAVAAALSLHASGRFDPAFYAPLHGTVISWFEADHPNVLHAVSHADSGGQRLTGRHPLFVVLVFPVMRALLAGGLDAVSAARWMLASWAALTAALLLLALRGLGLPRAACALFTGVFLASATFTHWFVVFDTHSLAAVSMSVMLLILTSVDARRRWIWIAGSVATLSITLTNWSLGLVAALARQGLRRAAVTTASAMAIVVLVALVQEMWFPASAVFFGPSSLAVQSRFARGEARQFVANRGMPRTSSFTAIAAARLRGLLVTSAVAPVPEVVQGENPRRKRLLVVNQYSPRDAYTASGWVALVSWLTLLVAGVLGGSMNVERRRVFAAVCVFLTAQIALHLFIGEVTFLYVINGFAAFVVLTAFGWFSPLRVPVVIAALLFVVFGGLSNHAQFNTAIRLLDELASSG